jgi:TRAP transporter solute receptor, TAXI family
MRTKNNFFLMAVMALAGAMISSVACATSSPLKIGTGSVTGVYYPAGGAICRLINRSHKLDSRCTVEATDGSLYNIFALQKGELSIAIVQSDVQYAAVEGKGHFATAGADHNLRALFSLYAEPLTLVTRSNSGITSLADIPGKRIDIGNQGSGDRNMMELLFQTMKWQTSEFPTVTELKAAERAQALCDEKIDLFPYVAGHPSGAIKEASNSCDITFIPVAGPDIELLLKQHPELNLMNIDEGLYRGVEQPTTTIGVFATVITTTALDEESAYQIVKSVFDNFEQFKRLHPAFALLKKEALVKTGLSAPLHPGAVRYFKEVGLLK